MLNLFQYINNLLFSKNKKSASKENCSDSLGGFMLNRWTSFYDKENCCLVNSVCNKPHITEDVDLLSKFLITFVPKKEYRKINYIKKIKQESEDPTSIICKIMEIGKRDAEIICKTIDKEDLKKFLKIYNES